MPTYAHMSQIPCHSPVYGWKYVKKYKDATALSMVEKLRNTNQYIGGTLAMSLICPYYTSHSLQRCQFEEVLRHGEGGWHFEAAYHCTQGSCILSGSHPPSPQCLKPQEGTVAPDHLQTTNPVTLSNHKYTLKYKIGVNGTKCER